MRLTWDYETVMIMSAALNPDYFRSVTCCFLGDIRSILEDLGMRKLLLAFAAAGALSLPSAAARADTVVYNGGAPDQGGITFAESTFSFVAAMNFTLPAGVTSINDANWWGGCFSGSGVDSCGSSPSFTLSIYSDSGGSGPGALITSFPVGGANQTATGNTIGGAIGSGGFDEYSYSASFAPISLTPGTEYWFALTGTTGPDNLSFGIETTSTAPDGAQQYTMGIFPAPPTWHLQTEQGAFELTDTVPEPSTWAMMLLGFAGLGFLAYRKRAAVATA